MKRTFINGLIAISMLGSVTVAAKPMASEPTTTQTPTTNWFFSMGLGVQFPQSNGTMTVENGGGFPAPYNVDTYTTDNPASTALALSAGHRWLRETPWLPAYSLGLFYQHFFEGNVGGIVTQYSLPEFANYTYQWNVSTDMLLATAKVNLYQFAQVSPYITAGLGAAFNRSSGYQEQALPDVTPLISPGFSSNSVNQFAYNLGLGLDFQTSEHWICSIAYLYQDLGSLRSGNGTNEWSNTALNLGSQSTNEVMVSVLYLLG